MIRRPSTPGFESWRRKAVGSAFRAPVVVGFLVVLLLLPFGAGATGGTVAATGGSGLPAPPHASATATGFASSSVGISQGGSSPSSVSQSFDRRVLETASALRAAGLPTQDLRLPYIGPPSRLVDGAVVPGYAASPTNVTAAYSDAPAPFGVAYYGENDTSGAIEATTLDASSVVGSLTVNQLTALYENDLTPDMWGVQLNAVLTNVTIQGVGGNEFWLQNTIDYFQHDNTLNLGEDTWNFSGPSANIPPGTSTIMRHSPNGTDVQGVYVGEGPTLRAPMPFTLTLFLNSSLTSTGEQECWYNYSLAAADGIDARGNYDWIIFNSTNSRHPGATPLAVFQATGTHLDPVGLPNDFELDFGLGPYDGSTIDDLAANATATLDYCPASIRSCTSAEFESVPAAEDFGGETGETAMGLALSYTGTTAQAAAGPFLLRGLWGFPAAPGSEAGATPVANDITFFGSPEAGVAPPYVFVFFNGSALYNPRFEWAPDVPVWRLSPGTYQYEVMLADYAEQTGTITVGTAPTALSVTLSFHPSSGVYTPLWAFGNAELGGISASGSGTISHEYRLFNNPTSGCTECGDAKNGNLSSAFFSLNDFDFPTFMGIWLVGTDAYVDVDRPVSFCVFTFSYGPSSSLVQGPYFYLQIGLVMAHHVTLSNDTEAGGWPAMAEITTLSGMVDAAENPFPQANVMIWNSTDNLVMSNTFVPAWLVPSSSSPCTGVCAAVTCGDCVSPDGLLLYGGTNNTIWGNTFRDPTAPLGAPTQAYGGLAEGESGDLIYNNNFSVDNPTVLLPFDIYNNSCPDGYAGDCAPPIVPTYRDTWNVTIQSASTISARVNGVALSGNILGAACPTQGGNFWINYGTSLNPAGVLPYTNVIDYYQIRTSLPNWTSPIQSSIQIGGDYAPLVRSGSCGITPPPAASNLLSIEYVLLGTGITAVAIAIGVVVLRPLLRVRPAPWLVPPSGTTATGTAEGDLTVGAVVARPTDLLPALPTPTLRDQWARRPFGAGMWTGFGILVGYVVAAIGAIIVYGNSLDRVPINQNWIEPFSPLGPSLAHPFGVLTGLGTDLFRAVWQATPWDLAIVAGILAFDALLGWTLGSLAGMYEGGTLDSVVMFLGDTLGAIPSVFLVVALFAGLWTVAPSSVGLPLFVVLFGLVIWPTTARTTRERARLVAREPFIEAARASGAGSFYLFFRHLLPNSVSPLLAQLPIDVAPIFFVLTIFPWFWDCAGPGGAKGTYYLIASLPPYSPLPAVNFPEWGNLLAVGACEGLPISTVGTTYWWMVFFPLVAIVFLGLGIALLCDGIDKRLNARDT